MRSVNELAMLPRTRARQARGLITRTRDTASRRIHVVQLTEAGEAAFLRLQQAAIAFDARLRAGLADDDLDNLSDLLGQLAANAGATEDGTPPWAGLAESRRQK